MAVDADRPSDEVVGPRHPVAASIALAAALAIVLLALWLALPLSGNVDHAAGHLGLAVPVLVLLTLALRSWPAPAVRAERITRAVLLVGLAVSGGALTLEAVGAFGYSDSNGHEAENGLATVHGLAVLVSAVGLLLTMAGAVLTVGVELARRHGRGGPRHLTAAVALAVVAVVAFVAGGVVLGY